MTRPDLQAPPESPAFPRPPDPPAAPAAPTPAAAQRLPAPPLPDQTGGAGESELRIAWLEGRVAALEAALERRSQELRLLQRHLCARDLAQLARLTAGLPPLPRIACEPGFWRETRELTVADVPETMEALWSSLHPLAGVVTVVAVAPAEAAAAAAPEPAATPPAPGTPPLMRTAAP